MASSDHGVLALIPRRDLTPSQSQEFIDLLEAHEEEVRKLRGLLADADFALTFGRVHTEADLARIEATAGALIESLEAIEESQGRYATVQNSSIGKRRRSWVATELDRLRVRATSARHRSAPDDNVVLQVQAERHLDDLDTLKAAHVRRLEALKALTSVDSVMRIQMGIGLAQALVDEAAHRVEYELVSQARDQYSRVQRAESDAADPFLPPWLVAIDGVLPAIFDEAGGTDFPVVGQFDCDGVG